MMKLLVVASTFAEIEPFVTANKQVNHLVTGVGVPATIFGLMHYLQNNQADLIIQAGICGSFLPKQFPIGKVVQVKTDCFADLGAIEQHEMKTIFELGFADANKLPYTAGLLKNNSSDLSWNFLDAARGITINTISDQLDNAARYQKKFNADVESMEGAALHYVCNMMGIRYCQLRSVSNAVGNRNKADWNIALAITNLNTSLSEVVRRELAF